VRQLALILLLGAVCGCTAIVTLGSNIDAGSVDALVRCGPVDCAAGEVCCNVVCGACAPEGSCSSTSCPDAGSNCAADAVVLSGSPLCSSYVWNGSDCIQVSGCTCAGACTLPQPTYGSCMSLHGTCWSPTCNSARFCPNEFFCQRNSCADATGTCMVVPADCSTVRSTPTCGCDGVAYRTPCEAQRAMQTIAPTPICAACDAPAITLVPGCSTSLGWTWDGSRCVEQIGCSCMGACDRLEASQSACMSRYQTPCGGFFPCAAASCARNTQYCRSGSCVAFSSLCVPGTCDCLMLSASDTCTDDGAGGIVVTP